MATGTSSARPQAPSLDDYAVEREMRPPAGRATDRLLRLLNGLLLLVVAAISLGLCWIVGLLLHLF